MVWKPRVVVAAVIEKEGKFLVVEENVDNQKVINQPSGHLEPNESIIDAVRRETLEETGWNFEPTHLVGILHLLNPNTNRIFIRFTFTGKLLEQVPNYQIDPDIIAPRWMTYDEIKSQEKLSWRSPLVMRSLDEYRAGHRFSMDLIHTLQVDTEPCLEKVSPSASNQDKASSTNHKESLLAYPEALIPQ
ncbi:MAG: NUDIX hydrolase [Thiotrichaceae bacterium]